MTKREWQIEMANRFAKRDNVKELEAKLECYKRLVDSINMASNPISEKSRVALKNVREIKTIMTKEEEIRKAVEAEREAWMDDYNACKCSDNETRCFSDRVYRMMQKYTAPPQRTWVGLTDDEVQNIVDCRRPTVVNIRKAEQLLKDKNI